jgi:hypothetical protein
VLDGLLGRLLLAVVRTGARAVVIDAGGATEPAGEACLAALGRLAAHPYASSRPLRVVCAGVPVAAQAAWSLALMVPGQLVVVFAADFAEGMSAAARE